ncbi:hypothetical protein ACLB2K_063425 [Fragaria x ananassa]
MWDKCVVVVCLFRPELRASCSTQIAITSRRKPARSTSRRRPARSTSRRRPARVPRCVPYPNHLLNMEKDQDLLKSLEVPNEAYRIVTPLPPPPPPRSSKPAANLGKKKKRHHQLNKKVPVTLDTQVTYTEKDVTGDTAPNPKRVKVTPGGATPSLSLLAAPTPIVPKSLIRQVLDEYGCPDEKFVRAMIRDFKGIDLDQARFKEGSYSES